MSEPLEGHRTAPSLFPSARSVVRTTLSEEKYPLLSSFVQCTEWERVKFGPELSWPPRRSLLSSIPIRLRFLVRAIDSPALFRAELACTNLSAPATNRVQSEGRATGAILGLIFDAMRSQLARSIVKCAREILSRDIVRMRLQLR